MRRIVLGIVTTAFAASVGLALRAQQPNSDGPRYVNNTHLMRPEYREWVFIGSSLNLTYGPPQANPQFGNVFVNPSSYRSFLQTGKWPNGTVLVLENRRSGVEGAGRYQSDFAGMEAHVKDSRFPDGWAFFAFGGAQALKDVAEPLPPNVAARCVECHDKNTAVETTFVQFYPTLMEAARKLGTVKPTYRE